VSAGRMLVGAAILASVLLCGTYLAAGGAAYEPAAVHDPCQERQWRSPDGVAEIAEQFSLSALDGAACELQVSRETLARALATPATRDAFAERYGIDDARLEEAVRAGLRRAVDDAEEAGAIDPLVAAGLRAIAARVPLEEAIALIEDSRGLIEDARGIGAAAEELLDEAGELVP
jgi:hypothetical protein